MTVLEGVLEAANSSGSATGINDVLVDGGTLTRDDSASFDLAAGKMLTAQNNGQVNFVTSTTFNGYNINNGTAFNINSGADLLTAPGFLVGEGGGNG